MLLIIALAQQKTTIEMNKLANFILLFAILVVSTFAKNIQIKNNGLSLKSTGISHQFNKIEHLTIPSAELLNADFVGHELVAQSSTESSTLLDKIWNDNTKLLTYLAVWYLGNIYCKYL